MMEAAAAYYEATGKDRLLKVMERMADHIASRFGTDKQPGIPAHQEIEIGLMKLYHATGKDKYRELAQYFLDERGRDPAFFKKEKGAGNIFASIRRTRSTIRALHLCGNRRRQRDTA